MQFDIINMVFLGFASAAMYQPTKDLINALCKRFANKELPEKFCIWCFMLIYLGLVATAKYYLQ